VVHQQYSVDYRVWCTYMLNSIAAQQKLTESGLC
jgi:hypothetical protein